MDYPTLTSAKTVAGSIADWTNDGRINVSAPTIVDEAQDWIYQRLRHWRMMPPAVTGTLSTAGLTLPPPADLLEPNFFLITGVSRRVLQERTMQEVMGSWQYDGNGVLVPQQPCIYSFDNTNFNFDSVPDQAYPYSLLYYQMPARLSNANPTNFLTTYCERLVRLACMMMACEWTKEIGQGQFDRTYYEELADAELTKVQSNSDRARRASTGGWIDGTGMTDGGWPR